MSKNSTDSNGDQHINKKKQRDSKVGLTNAQTDTESGIQGLDDQEETKKALTSLKIMYSRGLLTEKEYQHRLKELKNGE